MSENPVGRRAYEHSEYFQPQVTPGGSGSCGSRIQRRRRVIQERHDNARDGGHRPHFPLEAHQHGHHRRDDAGFGREQAHLVAGYLTLGRDDND